MSKNRPFDLRKLDFEKIRQGKRQKLLRYSFPACAVILLVAIKLTSFPLLSLAARAAYKNGDNSQASFRLSPIYIMNLFESYKVFFNDGNALYKQARYDSAEKQFRQALQKAPKTHECPVHINLALSIEAQADALASEKRYDQAIIRYDEANAVLHDGEDSCGVQFASRTVDANNDDGKTAIVIEQRIRQKLAQIKQLRNGDQGISVTNPGDKEKVDAGSTDGKLKELDKRFIDAYNEQRKSQERSQHLEDYKDATPDHTKRNW